MKLITEVIDHVNVVTEELNEATGKKDFFIEGIFMQGNMKNRNGRIYPMEILRREVDRYNDTYIKNSRAYGELNHPNGPTINLDRVSHMIKELYQDGNNFMGKAKIIDTPCGNIVKNLISEGANLGVSSRGIGTVRKNKSGLNEVQEDFHLSTPADIVADPSAPDAFVNGIMEGVDWVYQENLGWVPQYMDEAKKYINNSKRGADREAAKMKVFEEYIRRLGSKY